MEEKKLGSDIWVQSVDDYGNDPALCPYKNKVNPYLTHFFLSLNTTVSIIALWKLVP